MSIIDTVKELEISNLPDELAAPMKELFCAAGIGNGERYAWGVGEQSDEVTQGYAVSYEDAETVGICAKLDKWLMSEEKLKEGETINVHFSW